ncbi:GNAT family N-acetyltransferase [Noviherbaspirillum pedocola]|uniref:L-ornithine N(alpha)-acyltransferase n=1 Tax=Noviherbaspirillum pedocola TaxID=2801341 RepID=A0A934W3B4_9BURK|nr:GNAT family N-acyltransferase [Noviherbaspirillum pedocola]MBK4737261.1 GNAT family N-acetyltransferase [Noviherbaspirillum pedocola]
MRQLTSTSDADVRVSRLAVSLASNAEEIREVQRLRYKAFIDAMGLSGMANAEGLDRDEFDDYCDHLIVRDTRTLKVVGTYRLLTPRNARRHGSLYSEQEFDLSRLEHLRDRMLEAGRACIHPDYRGGSVLTLLWGALAAFMRRERCDYLVGCASISLADGGHNATAVYRELAQSHLSPAEYRVTPHLPFPLHEGDCNAQTVVPPLLKGYLRGGAWICGEPAWDPNFHCADLLLLLSLARLESRYARRYLKKGA